jgi:hypothetical protein
MQAFVDGDVKTIKPPVFTKAKPQEDGFCVLQVSDRQAVIVKSLKRPGKNQRRIKIQTAYFGFDSLEKAQAFHSYFTKNFRARAEVRPSERLGTPFEVKVWECLGLIDLILECARKGC